jgi:GNAT superfamily N-acetyltransferase
MSEKPTIRFAVSTDLNALVRLCALHAAYEKAGYDVNGKEESLRQHLFKDQPNFYCLVVEQGHELIGYATYMLQFSTWDAGFYIYMDCLFLTENSRGYGIGEALIDRIKEEGRKNACALIQWQTPDFNERAIKFYHRIGATNKKKERFFLKI